MLRWVGTQLTHLSRQQMLILKKLSESLKTLDKAWMPSLHGHDNNLDKRRALERPMKVKPSLKPCAMDSWFRRTSFGQWTQPNLLKRTISGLARHRTSLRSIRCSRFFNAGTLILCRHCLRRILLSKIPGRFCAFSGAGRAGRA
jgi:hypothetical protein